MIYKLIVIEGLDRSGKSSISKLLRQRLEPSILLTFPDRNSTIGEIIDKFLKKEIYLDKYSLHLLYSADRYEKKDFILNSLKNSHVICDRYWLSGLVYSAAKDINYEWSKNVDSLLPKADYTFLIDIDAKEVSGRDGFGSEAHDKMEFQKKVYKMYKSIAPLENVIELNGNRPTEEIVQEILEIVNQ